MQRWIKMLSPQSVISSTSTSIAIDNQENIFVCGKADINNSPGFITLKYNSAGDSIWSKVYTTPNSNTEDCAYSICSDSAGNSYVTGKSFLGNGNVQFEMVTISYNPAGSQRWIMHYNNNMSAINNIPVQISLNRNNKPIICAFSTGQSSYFDFLSIRLGNTGQPEGEQRFHAPLSQDNVPSAMCIDNNSDIYFTGYLNQGYPKAVTVKFADNLFGIHKIGFHVPDKFLLYQNYPNPFNPETNLIFQIPKPAFVKLTVIDLLGREIETLINEHLIAGVYKTEWNAINYSSGVYFYRIAAGDFVDVKKMVIIK
jgi:type IX secretion system substrate protein